ncbi:MAG: hypothetical protein KG003_15040 [Bacteroidetes bacterium]|nr:hypothetical protein [Bacteroidota bacterium]
MPIKKLLRFLQRLLKGKKFSFSIILGFIITLLVKKRAADFFGISEIEIDKSNLGIFLCIVSIFVCLSILFDGVRSKYKSDINQDTEIGKNLGIFEGQNINLSELREKMDRAICNLEKLKLFWMWAVISWLLFYIVSLIFYCIPYTPLMIYFKEDPVKITRIADVLLNAINLLNSFFLLLCYFILGHKTYDEKFMWPKSSLFSSIFIALVIVCINIGVNASPVKDLKDETIIKVLIHASYINLLIGLISGVILGLLTSRLDSRFISPRAFYIACLFLYVGIQMTYPIIKMGFYKFLPEWKKVSETAFQESVVVSAIFIGIACVGKWVLFRIIERAKENHGLLIYFLRLTTLKEITPEYRKTLTKAVQKYYKEV